MMINSKPINKIPSFFFVPGIKDEGVALCRPLREGLPADCISTALISTGLCMALFISSVFDTGFFSNLWPVCLSVLLIAVFSVRWWVGPASLGIAFTGIAIYQYTSGTLEELTGYLSSLFDWFFFGGVYDDVYSENGSILFLRLATIFLISLAVFLLVRKLIFFPVPIALAASLFVIVYIMTRSDLSLALVTSAAGLIPLVARYYGEYAQKHGDERSEVKNRSRMQLIAVPGAILAVALSLYMVPEDTSVWRWKWLNDMIQDISDLLNGPLEYNTGIVSGFTLYDMGFQKESDRLGGPVRLRADKMFTVTGIDQSILLRGAVMDYYDGQRWLASSYDGDLRYKRFFWRGYRSETFDLDKPLGNFEAKRIYQNLTSDFRYELKYENGRFSSVFAGGRVRDIGFANNDYEQDVFFNIRSEIYMHTRVPVYQPIKVRSRVWDFSTPDFDKDFLRLEELTLGSKDEMYESILNRYTQIYDGLPVSIIETAAEITKGIDSPYLKAKAIQKWLSENSSYTLDPEMPPDDADFVKYFLNTGEGYCSYYASAMAVLARCSGLPSRYVEGFALEHVQDGKLELYQATGKTVHAWAEIYFKGIGWVEFDPLYWNAEEPLNRLEEVTPPPPPAPYVNIQPDTQKTTPDEIPVLDLNESEETFDVQRDSWLWIAAAVITGVAALIALIWWCLKLILTSNFRYYEANKVIRRSGGVLPALDAYHKDIAKQLSILGLEARPGETLKSFAPRVDRRFKIENESFAIIAECLMRTHFAGVMPSRSELDVSQKYHSALEQLVLTKLGKPVYILRRVILRRASL